MTRRGGRTAPAVLVLVAGLAWWLSVDRMEGMNAGPSTELGGLGWFTATWLVMMAAMMLPASIPALRRRDGGPTGQASPWPRPAGPAAAVSSYLAVWTLAGVSAYLILRTGGSLFGNAFAWQRGGRWLCVAVIAVAGGYQLTAAKRRELARCRAPVLSAETTMADGLRAGRRAGLRCLASSWALMAALFALGAMSLVWMAAVALLVAAERLAPPRWWRGDGRLLSIRTTSATLLIALAAALAVSPGAIPGFTVPGSSGARQAMMRMDGTDMGSR